MEREGRLDLDEMFRHDLGPAARISSDSDAKPLMATVAGTGMRIQAYLWKATAPFEREIGAHKIQITLPGAPKGERIHIPTEPGRLVLFCGYAETFDAWILWDAELFMTPEGISYSRNLQVSIDGLAQASAEGVAVTTKNLRETALGPHESTIVTCRRTRLLDALEIRLGLNIERVLGRGK